MAVGGYLNPTLFDLADRSGAHRTTPLRSARSRGPPERRASRPSARWAGGCAPSAVAVSASGPSAEAGAHFEALWGPLWADEPTEAAHHSRSSSVAMKRNSRKPAYVIHSYTRANAVPRRAKSARTHLTGRLKTQAKHPTPT